jgi:hypothetical protein
VDCPTATIDGQVGSTARRSTRRRSEAKSAGALLTSCSRRARKSGAIGEPDRLIFGALAGMGFDQPSAPRKPECWRYLPALITSIVAPLMFASLVVGIARTGNVRAMGRVGVKALVVFQVLTTLALLIGAAAALLISPGSGINTFGANAAAILGCSASLGLPEEPFPHQHHRCHGARRHSANRGLRDLFRIRLRGDRRCCGTRGPRLRLAGRGDVSLHPLRDVFALGFECRVLGRQQGTKSCSAWARSS